MKLTSLRRMLAYVVGKSSTAMTSNESNNRFILFWIKAVSNQIEKYLNRYIEINTRNEYFDIKSDQREFFPKAIPVNSVSTVYYDVTGLWDGSETELTDTFIGVDDNTVCIPYSIGNNLKKALKITYSGGLAYHAVNSQYVLSNIAGTITVGDVARGDSTGSVGYVAAWASPTITIENYYGHFDESETIKFHISTDEGGTGSTLGTSTLSSVISRSLLESYPEIVLACEAQTRYYWKHANDFESSGTTKDGSNIRRDNVDITQPLQPEVLSLIANYRRMAF